MKLVNDLLNTSSGQKRLLKLTPIQEGKGMTGNGSAAVPLRRKSLDPRAMNKTITHASGLNLLSGRLNDKQMMKYMADQRQTSLADVNKLAQTNYLKAKNTKTTSTIDQNQSTAEISATRDSHPQYKGFFYK